VRRNVSALARKEFDLVIVGGGIYGASVAREAALRGLTVALVDQGDFANATSANSHKIIHGGLRYLQHADLKRMRESIRERSTLFRIAPHLVRPLPVLVPLYGHWSQTKLVMSLALKINDLISIDRNRGLQPSKIIPSGRVLSKDESLNLCPGLNPHGLTGGALFYDGQVYNPERLILSILRSAETAGADLANYVRVNGVLKNRNVILGVSATDMLAGNPVEIRAHVVVNCSGPWVDWLLRRMKGLKHNTPLRLLKAVVLVTRPIVDRVALSVPGRAVFQDHDAILDKGYRYFVIAPWRDTSLVGTFQVPYDSSCEDLEVTEKEIETFIQEVNAAYEAAALTREDIRHVYVGLLPRADIHSGTGEVQMLKHYRILDHSKADGTEGLVSVIGVKYTTARDVAERVVDLVFKKLSKRWVPSQTARLPVYGGELEDIDRVVNSELAKEPKAISNETIRHLIQTYGSHYRDIIQYARGKPALFQPVDSTATVTKAEIVYGVREEMAQKLSDVIFRRTELGTAGYPGDACLETSAAIIAQEMGWREERILREIEDVRAIYRKVGCKQWVPHDLCASS